MVDEPSHSSTKLPESHQQNNSCYDFRIRFRLGNTSRVTGVSTGNWLPLDPEGQVTIGVWDVDDQYMIVRGREYGSAEQAQVAAEKWRAALMLAFARLNMGADFGTRAPHSTLTPTGRRLLENNSHPRQVLDDVHGILVFPSEPDAIFVSAGPIHVLLTRPVEQVIDEAAALAEHTDLALDDGQLIAHTLFASAFSETSTDARFLMLMMAIETILKRESRSLSVVQHVEGLLEQTQRPRCPATKRTRSSAHCGISVNSPLDRPAEPSHPTLSIKSSLARHLKSFSSVRIRFAAA